MNRTQLLSAGLAVLLVGGGAVVATHMLGAPPAAEPEEEHEAAAPIPVRVAAVRRGRFGAELQVTGRLRALPNGRSRVAAQVSGRVESLRVRAGDAVRAGQLLATISRPDLAAQTRQAAAGVVEAEREIEALRAEREVRAAELPAGERRARADLASAQSKLALLQAGSRREEIERAEAAVRAEQADLDRLRAGNRPQEIAQAEAAVRDARAQREALAREATRRRSLFEKGIAAAKEVERANADLTAAEAGLDAKEQALSLAKAGARPEEIRAQESRLQQAESQLQQAKAGARPEELRDARAAVDAARAAVAQAEASRPQLRSLTDRLQAAGARLTAARELARAAALTSARTSVTAPISGVVSQVTVGVGDGVAEQAVVLEIVNRSALRVVLDIPAAQAGDVLGARVELTVPGAGGRKLGGVVRALPAQADPETGFLPAEVSLNDPSGRGLAEGMAVNAVLRRRNREAGLFVPTSALFSREGEQFVYRVENAEEGKAAKEQAVETGREAGDQTEIRSGLHAGDLVVRDGSLSLADDALVKVQP